MRKEGSGQKGGIYIPSGPGYTTSSVRQTSSISTNQSGVGVTITHIYPLHLEDTCMRLVFFFAFDGHDFRLLVALELAH